MEPNVAMNRIGCQIKFNVKKTQLINFINKQINVNL
jgi:hypothetical protein